MNSPGEYEHISGCVSAPKLPASFLAESCISLCKNISSASRSFKWFWLHSSNCGVCVDAAITGDNSHVHLWRCPEQAVDNGGLWCEPTQFVQPFRHCALITNFQNKLQIQPYLVIKSCCLTFYTCSFPERPKPWGDGVMREKFLCWQLRKNFVRRSRLDFTCRTWQSTYRIVVVMKTLELFEIPFVSCSRVTFGKPEVFCCVCQTICCRLSCWKRFTFFSWFSFFQSCACI